MFYLSKIDLNIIEDLHFTINILKLTETLIIDEGKNLSYLKFYLN